MNTTAEPGPERRNGSIRARQIITPARRFTLSVASQSSSSMKSTGIAPDTPAAWTNPPSEPRAVSASGTAVCDGGGIGHVDRRPVRRHPVPLGAEAGGLLGPGGVHVPDRIPAGPPRPGRVRTGGRSPSRPRSPAPRCPADPSRSSLRVGVRAVARVAVRPAAAFLVAEVFLVVLVAEVFLVVLVAAVFLARLDDFVGTARLAAVDCLAAGMVAAAPVAVRTFLVGPSWRPIGGLREVPWAQSDRTVRRPSRWPTRRWSGPEAGPRLHARVDLRPHRIGLVPGGEDRDR